MIIQKPSPNFVKGRGDQKIEAIVLHIMDGSLAGTDDWFSRTISQVSSHYGIGLNGEVHQYVQDEDTAWHAGKIVPPASWKLLKNGINPNTYTIGIEHEGHDLLNAPVEQLNASVALIRSLCAKWGIPVDRDHIVGHYQIKVTKPNCPATDKSIIDRIIALAQPEEMISLDQVPKSKLERIMKFLNTL